MAWRVVMTTGADRAFRKLERSNREMAVRIKDELIFLREQANPHLFLKQLEGFFPPSYSRHIGRFRVVVEMDDVNKRIIVRGIGQRKNIYNKL